MGKQGKKTETMNKPVKSAAVMGSAVTTTPQTSPRKMKHITEAAPPLAASRAKLVSKNAQAKQVDKTPGTAKRDLMMSDHSKESSSKPSGLKKDIDVTRSEFSDDQAKSLTEKKDLSDAAVVDDQKIAPSVLPSTPDKRMNRDSNKNKTPARPVLKDIVQSPEGKKGTAKSTSVSPRRTAARTLDVGNGSNNAAPRRSVRSREKKIMPVSQIENMLRRNEEPGLKKVQMHDMGGYGVIAEKSFPKGFFVCEYSGDLISIEAARERENAYIEEDRRKGIDESMCYMYYLKHNGKTVCVDATKSGRIGRLINHSRQHPNLKTKMFIVDKIPRLGLCAIRDIEVGEELLYDYGERDPDAIKAHPWLRL